MSTTAPEETLHHLSVMLAREKVWAARSAEAAQLMTDTQRKHEFAELAESTVKQVQTLETAIAILEVLNHPGFRGCERVENRRFPGGVHPIWWFANIQGSPNATYGHGGPTLLDAILKAHEAIQSTPAVLNGDDRT